MMSRIDHHGPVFDRLDDDWMMLIEAIGHLPGRDVLARLYASSHNDLPPMSDRDRDKALNIMAENLGREADDVV